MQQPGVSVVEGGFLRSNMSKKEAHPHASLTSRLTGDHSKIYQREFRTYNEEHLLVEILTDDGCEAAKEDYTGVTCQKFTCITPRLDGRAVGFPQTIVEGYIDLSTGQRMPLKRIEHIYDERELLVEQRIFEAAQQSMDDDGASKFPIRREHAPSFEETFIHPSAVVDAGAQVGPGTKVWHFSHIMKGASVGPCCNLGQNVVISPGVSLGRNVKVQNNVSLYTGVSCEDDVFIGPSAVFTNILNPRSAVSRKDEFLPTILRQGATVGANATIVCGVELGAYCLVGAGTVVTKDVKSYALVYGNPARQEGWVSRHGERLELPASLPEGHDREAECPVTGERYRLEGSDLELVCAAVIP